MVRQVAEVTLCISERLRLSPGHHAYGSAARPLRPQIKDGVVLEYIHFHHFQCRTESFKQVKYAGYNFLTQIQNPETVDFGIIC